MAHATEKLTGEKKKCKHVVRFETDLEQDDADRDDLLITNIYVSKKGAKSKLGVTDLMKIKGFEVTLRVIK